MTVKSGQPWARMFVSLDATGALSAATVGPAGTLYVDGVANGASVTVTGANPYKWAVTLPALTAGQCVSMYITATVDSVATASVVAEDVADTSLVSDLAATLGTAGAGLTALGDTRLANLDATVSSRSSHSAASAADAVWDEAAADHVAAGSTGLALSSASAPSAATVAAAVWAYSTRTLTSLSALVSSIAAAVWTYATRTLTMSPAAIATATSSSSITRTRGDTWSISLTGLGNISGYTDVWFTMKESPTLTDAEALLLISKTVGLERLNGAAGTALNASLVVDDASAGNITVTVSAATTAALTPSPNYLFDVQWMNATGLIYTLTAGTFDLDADVTRATS